MTGRARYFDLGSSPRTWGTLDRCVSQARCQLVHPHARGERGRDLDAFGHAVGSSPRTWGTPPCLRPAVRVGRFIPTHVGNAGYGNRRSGSRAVHPHARGERSLDRHSMRFRDGSSPRTWGTLIVIIEPTPSCRFIPTHVGNAMLEATTAWLEPVHPHARGERHYRRRNDKHPDGSSPRTWGTRQARRNHSSLLPVHPHARGERSRQTVSSTGTSGSSPRTWGTLPLDIFREGVSRFIPTHVGNAVAATPAVSASPVHPHARGERTSGRSNPCLGVGSSPRTWGTQL